MTTYSWAILSLALVVAPVTAATAAPPTQQAVNAFVIHKAQGDDARLHGRLSEALMNYQQALAIRYDPEVAGNAGLVLSKLGEFDSAALELHRVVTETSTSLSRVKRKIFSDEYEKVRRKVCRVDVTIDQVGARVEIDHVERGKGRANFWLFLKPGDHVIRARLPNFEDTIAGFVAEAGCPESTIALVMQPVPIKSSPSVVTTTTEPVIMPNTQEVPEHVPDGPLSCDKLVPNRLITRFKCGFVFGGGLWIPFGATPGVALGVQLQSAFRWLPRSDWWLEVGVGARAAWTLGTGTYDLGSVHIWTALFAPCARYREHFFGCALAEVNGGGLDPFNWRVFPGVGVRAGYEFHPSNRFSVAVFGDLELRFGSPKLNPGTYEIVVNKPVPGFVANALTFF